jgi:acyl CoA:acetate/3-ketoacid CoA transferase beta subunit
MPVKPLTRDEIARRAGRDIPDGAYVNLGIGFQRWQPTTCRRTARLYTTVRTAFSG